MSSPRKMAEWTMALAALSVLIILLSLLAGALWFGAARGRGYRGMSAQREQMRRSLCAANLRRIQAAKEQWAMTHKVMGTDMPAWSDLVGPGKPFAEMPLCPSGGRYEMGDLFTLPACSVSGHTFEPAPPPPRSAPRSSASPRK